MKFFILKGKNILVSFGLIFALLILIILLQYLLKQHHDITKMVMGGSLIFQEDNIKNLDNNDSQDIIITKDRDVETYFRPSKEPVLNDRSFERYIFHEYKDGEYSKVHLSDRLFNTPEDTIINYFSILREAANPTDDKWAGCGTLGNATLPYPVAYQFLSAEYRKNLSYEDYLKTFENILHISLIKIKNIPVFDLPEDTIRYFVEIETIEGSEKGSAYFAYYYAYIDLVKEDNLYKISNIDFIGENYLCAPYHGWSYDAEAVVQIEYGGWCSFIKELHPTIQEGYIKKVPFLGTDGKEYIIVFFHLTNDTDIEIAQYVKDSSGNWILIKLDPYKCIKNN